MYLLPNELLLQVFCYLHGTDVLNLRRVCKHFKNLVFEHHGRLPRVSLGTKRPQSAAEWFRRHYDPPVHLRLVFCRSRRTVSVEQRYRRASRHCEMKWDEFSGVYRHVSIRNFCAIVVFARTLDGSVVDMLHLLEYRPREEAKILFKVNDMKVSRSTFRRLVIHMQAYGVDLCGLFDRSFISNTLFAGTRVQSFNLGSKKGEVAEIGVDFLESFFENWIYYQTLCDYARFRGVEAYYGESIFLQLPYVCLEDTAKFERLLTIYFRSLARLTDTDRLWHGTSFIHVFDVSLERMEAFIKWCEDMAPNPNFKSRELTLTDGEKVEITFSNHLGNRVLQLTLQKEINSLTQRYPTVERLKRLPGGGYPTASLKEPAPSDENERSETGRGLLHPEHIPYEIPDFKSSKEFEKYLRATAPTTLLERVILERKLETLKCAENTVYLNYRKEQERKYVEEKNKPRPQHDRDTGAGREIRRNPFGYFTSWPPLLKRARLQSAGDEPVSQEDGT